MRVEAIKRFVTIGWKASRDGLLQLIRHDNRRFFLSGVEPDAIQKMPQLWPTHRVGECRERETGMGAATRLAIQDSLAAHDEYIQLVVRIGEYFFLASTKQRIGQRTCVSRHILGIDFFRILLLAISLAKRGKCCARIAAAGGSKTPGADGCADELDRFGSISEARGQPIGKQVFVKQRQPQSFRATCGTGNDIDVVGSQTVFAQVLLRARPGADDEGLHALRHDHCSLRCAIVAYLPD